MAQQPGFERSAIQFVADAYFSRLIDAGDRAGIGGRCSAASMAVARIHARGEEDEDRDDAKGKARFPARTRRSAACADGLAPGESVVLSPNSLLADGEVVRIR